MNVLAGPYDYLLDNQGQIPRDLIDDLLIEIISGRAVFISTGEMYATRSPTLKEQDTARIVFAKRLHECQKQGLPTRKEMGKRYLDLGYFDAGERAEMQSIEDMIARIAVARERTHDPVQKVELAAEVDKMRTKLFELKFREEEVYLHSAESRADDTRTDYLVSCCTLAGELLDKPVWEGWENFRNSTDLQLIYDSRKAFTRVSGGLPIKIIRAVARSTEWKARWKSAKESGCGVFDSASQDWDANKRNLAWWSDFYDSIAKHPEAPREDIVNNDDFLQDWLNQQVAKVNKAKAGKGTPPGKAPPTYLDGHGRRQQMQRVSSEQINVAEPYAFKV